MAGKLAPEPVAAPSATAGRAMIAPPATVPTSALRKVLFTESDTP